MVSLSVKRNQEKLISENKLRLEKLITKLKDLTTSLTKYAEKKKEEKNIIIKQLKEQKEQAGKNLDKILEVIRCATLSNFTQTLQKTQVHQSNQVADCLSALFTPALI